MKNKMFIIVTSFLAVLICLIIVLLLFYAVPPSLLITLSLTIGFICGVCVTLMIHNLINIVKNKKGLIEK